MVLVIDTRFLIAHTLPPSEDERIMIKDFTKKLAKEEIIIPSIVIVEFLKVVGSVIGKDSAKIRLRLWIGCGAKIVPINEEVAFAAGEMALVHKNLPLADAIIGAVARQFRGKIISDDPHFNRLDLKTIWYK
ncbi:MAG: PIN domain-containing protein [Nitrososphaeria archaeon]|nr:PIN domain-containing protein [Nitrososphaeria archaeon]